MNIFLIIPLHIILISISLRENIQTEINFLYTYFYKNQIHNIHVFDALILSSMFLTSTRISLIVCRGLVRSYKNNTKLTAPELAALYNLNIRILNTSLRTLVKAGVLNSQVGGSEPGFIFSRDPRSISLFEIVTVFEGESKMMCCKDVISNIKCDVDDCANCLVYGGINQNLRDLSEKLKSISIYDHYKSCVNEKQVLDTITNVTE